MKPSLVEYSKAITPEQKAHRQRVEARIGQISNAVGMTAALVATHEAAGKYRAARAAAAGEELIKKPAGPLKAKLTDFKAKNAIPLAAGALALQAGSLGGDAVGAKVLARSAKAPAGTAATAPTDPNNPDPNAVTKALSPKVKGGLIAGGIVGAIEAPSARRKYRNGKAATKFWNAYRTASPEQRAHVKQQFTEGYTDAKAHSKLSKGMTMTGDSYSDVYESEGHGDGRGRNLSSVEKAYIPTPELMLGTALPDEEILKRARRYDPEADRQRRMGLYAGLGGGGAAVTGQAAARKLAGSVDREKRTVKIPRLSMKNVPKGELKAAKTARAGLGLAALSALSGAGGVAAYRHGIHHRNQPYN